MSDILKKLLKFLGVLIGIIGIMVVVVVIYVQVNKAPTFAEIESPNLTLHPTQAQLERGKSLVQMNCVACHKNPETGILEGQFFGKNPLGTAYTANITRDREFGAGAYSSGELYRLLRTGVKRDHTLALPFMPKFVNMSEEDIQAMIAFMQSGDPSLTPSQISRKTNLSVLGKALVQFAWKPEPYLAAYETAPDLNDPVAYGRYLVTSQVMCFGCHSASHEVDMKNPEETAGYLAGGAEFGPELFSPSLLMTPEGLGSWTAAEFIQTVRSARKADGTELRPPMHGYPQLDSAEIGAIWAYLQTITPEQVVATGP